MSQELEEIVKGYRDKGIELSDEEAEKVHRFCIRKMEVAGIQNKEEYLPLLYEDEIRNYLYRLSVNATTMLRMMGKEAVVSV